MFNFVTNVFTELPLTLLRVQNLLCDCFKVSLPMPQRVLFAWRTENQGIQVRTAYVGKKSRACTTRVSVYFVVEAAGFDDSLDQKISSSPLCNQQNDERPPDPPKQQQRIIILNDDVVWQKTKALIVVYSPFSTSLYHLPFLFFILSSRLIVELRT